MGESGEPGGRSCLWSLSHLLLRCDVENIYRSHPTLLHTAPRSGLAFRLYSHWAWRHVRLMCGVW